MSPDRYDSLPSVSSHRDYPSDYSVKEDKKASRYPKHDPVSPRGHNRYPEHLLEEEVGRSRHGDPHLEHQPLPKGKSGDRYQSYDPVEAGRTRASWEEEPERAVRRKEKPSRPAPPRSPVDRERRRVEWEQRHGREERRDRDYRDRGPGPRDRDLDRGRGHGWDSDGQRQRDRERARGRSRDRGLDEEERGHARERPRDGRGSWEEERDDGGGGRERRAARGRHRVPSGPGDVFEEEARGRQHWDGGEMQSPSRRHIDSHLMEETGTTESPAHPLPSSPSFWALQGRLCGFCWSCFWKISGGGFGFTLKPLIKQLLTFQLICVA